MTEQTAPVLSVRPMEAGDVGQACAFLNQIIRTGGTTAMEAELSQQAFAASYLTRRTQICCHVVLDGQGDVAGFQWLGRNPNLPEGCADIASFTRRDPRLPGAGRALIAATMAAAKAAGFTTINATIRADNVPGLGYYSAMGFADHSVERGVPLADGRPIDRVSKRLVLV